MDAIDFCDTLYLDSMTYDHENARLVIVVWEGIFSDEPTDLVIGQHVLKGSRAVEITEKSKKFTVSFDWVMCYFVVDNFYQNIFAPSDEFVGNHLRTLKSGAVVDFINTNTLIPQVEEVGDYGVYCLVTDSESFFVCAKAVPNVS